LGPNGSGKTTSLKAAAGLIRPTSGDVYVGEPGQRAADPAARAGLSFLPQRVSFPEALTGRETLDFYRALRRTAPGRVDEVLRFASLNGSGNRPVGAYSGGMVQRLGLAVALLPDAPILLLDEPTAALDPDGLCAFYGVVSRHRAEGKTILFTSHQLGDVERLADRIAVLVAGRLVADLSAAELVERLADRGLMRIRLERLDDAVLAAVRAIVPAAARAGDELDETRGTAGAARVRLRARPLRGRPAAAGGDRSVGGQLLVVPHGDLRGPVRCTDRRSVV
jgi:Cu-processing system ATP-binding protein